MLRSVNLRMRRNFIKKNHTHPIHLFWSGKQVTRKKLQVFSQIPPFPILKNLPNKRTTIPYIILHSFPFFLSIQILSLKCTVRFQERFLFITSTDFLKYRGQLQRKKMNYEAAGIRNLGRLPCVHIRKPCKSGVKAMSTK